MRGRTLLIAGLLTVAYAGQASAQIKGTEHDLSGGAYDNGEVCVYCHTPHGSNDGVEAPLWNKPANTSSYSSYSSTTIDGDILAVGSVSIACLTCHDGTQAMDSVINAPGMGKGLGYLRDGQMFMEDGIANLGTDLTNDHPIGIQYSGFAIDNKKIDADFKGDGEGLVTADINGPVWWVDTGTEGLGSRDKTDMILYSRINTAPGASNALEPFVECASCHDPHNDTEAEVDTGEVDGEGEPIMRSTSVNFLRMANAGSAICLACHVK